MCSKFSQIPEANLETRQNVGQSNVDEYPGQQDRTGRHALKLEEACANQRVIIHAQCSVLYTNKKTDLDIENITVSQTDSD